MSISSSPTPQGPRGNRTTRHFEPPSWNELPQRSPDPIMAARDVFNQDPRPVACEGREIGSAKVNLTVGMMFRDDGTLATYEAVREAREVVHTGAYRAENKITGDIWQGEDMSATSRRFLALLSGELSAITEGRLAVMQTLGGTGAVYQALDLLAELRDANRLLGGARDDLATLAVPNATWPIHGQAGGKRQLFQLQHLSYFDPSSGELNFEKLQEEILALPRASVVVLHAVCHNPTGVDLTPPRRALFEAMAAASRKDLFLLVDMAYHGFGEGLEQDRCMLAEAIRHDLNLLVAYSCSKTFGSYDDRAGALMVITSSKEQRINAERVVEWNARGNYSSPPLASVLPITAVLESAELSSAHRSELSGDRIRLAELRRKLSISLERRLPGLPEAERFWKSWPSGTGMFSPLLCDFSVAEQFRANGLHMAEIDGLPIGHRQRALRMCFPGINAHNFDFVAEALARPFTSENRNT